MITETDVSLAKASNAILIAFNVKPTKEAKKLAEQEKINISNYNIIYEVLDLLRKKCLDYYHQTLRKILLVLQKYWKYLKFQKLKSCRLKSNRW